MNENSTRKKSSRTGTPIIITAVVIIALILIFKFVLTSDSSAVGIANTGIKQLTDNQLASSEKSFQEALRQDQSLEFVLKTNNPGLAYIGLGNLFAEKRDYLSAARYYDAAYKTDPEADFNKYSRFENTDLMYPEGFYLDLGNQFWNLGNLDLAEKTYRRPLAINPNSIAALTNLGNIEQRRGNQNEAVKKYNFALSIDPTAFEARANLLSMSYENKQQSVFDFNLKKFIEYHPEQPQTYHFIGIDKKNKGDYKAAIKSFETALELNTANIKTQIALIDCYLQTKQLKKADKLLEGLALRYNNIPDIYSRTLLTAEAFIHEDQVENAKKCYERYAAIWPDDPELKFGIANCAIKLNQNEEAQVILEEMIQRYPNSSQIYCNLGLVYADMGKFEWAKEQFMTAIGIDSTAIAYYNLGKVYEQIGDTVMANSMFLTATIKDPELFGLEQMIMNYSIEKDKKVAAGDTAGMIFKSLEELSQ